MNAEQLSAEIADIDQRLSELEAERVALLETRKSLLQAKDEALAQHFNQYAPAEDKIALFMSYFRGRADVYPFRWESQKGKSGYSPACFNEWKPGICNKPKISCVECRNQAFKPFTEETVYSHLSGQLTAGLYPLTEQSQTYFLAFDFDKDDWWQAILALSKTSDELGLPHIIERSRSGNGGHLWLFFTQAMDAADVRALGQALLNKTLDSYPALSIDSFDRLFPNQDALPEGGLGNLIALPLQKEPRQRGNSAFISQAGELYPDQWAALASVKKIDNEQLQELNVQLQPFVSIGYDENAPSLPWENDKALLTKQPMAQNVSLNVVMFDKLYISLEGLPSSLVAALKRLSVISNPEFFKRKSLRLSTIGVPRYICVAHIENQMLELPRGLINQVEELVQSIDSELAVEDKRFSGDELKIVRFKGELRHQQKKALKQLCENDSGVVVAKTGFGKTVVALALIARRKVNTLLLVHNKTLAEQWIERAKIYLPDTPVGQLLSGRNKLNGLLDVATYQSLISRNGQDVNELVHRYGQIIVDECHHLPASNYEALISSSRAKYIYGFTATPQRQDGLEKLMYFQLGEELFRSKSEKANFEQTVIVADTPTQFPSEFYDEDQQPKITDVYRVLVNCRLRNELIVNGVANAAKSGNRCLVLTERREHIQILSDMMAEKGINVVELHGGISAKLRRQRIEELNEGLPDNTVIVATGKYVGEGFDLPYLDTLFVGLPVAWKGIVAQYAGRIQRASSNKKEVRVFDYLDDYPMLARMWKKRANGYKAVGYKVSQHNHQTTLI